MALNNSNITGRVYITGQLTSTPEAKAAELTILVDNLTEMGIFVSIEEAIKQGVPGGTFVLVAPKDDLSIVVVMVVPNIFSKASQPVTPKN